MSNFRLGIFDNLGGYLTAVLTNSELKNRYFLQKYYGNNGKSSRDDDVAAEFTDAVVNLGKKLRSIDTSTSVVPSLKSLLLNALDQAVRQLDIKIEDDLLIDKLSGDMTADVVGDKLKNLKLTDIKKITNVLYNNVDDSEMTLGDKATAADFLKQFEESVESIELGEVTFTIYTEVIKVARDKVREVLKSKLLSELDKSYATSPTTGSSESAKRVLTALRNGLSDNEMELFNEYLLVLIKNGDKWQPATPAEISSADLSFLRVNVKIDDTAYGRAPKIVAAMPVLNVPKNRVWYSGAEEALIASSPDFLGQVLTEAYKGNDVTRLLPGFSAKVATRLNPDLQMLMKNVLEATYVPEAHIDDSDVEKIDSALKGTWKRVGANSWVHTLSDGSQVTISPGTPLYDEEISRQVSNCGAIGFGNDPAKCKAFLENVALNNQEELAKVALEMTEEVAATVVAGLHPKYALAILKAFGFHRKMCKDRVSGRQLEKIQRVGEWKEKFVDKKFDSSTAQSIKGNTRLCNFLDLLAQLVNANPSVLNDGLVVETEESKGEIVVPDDLVARKVSAVKSKKSGKPVLGWSEIQSNMNKIYGSFSRGLTFDGLSTNSPFGMDNLFPQMNLLTSAPVVRGSTWGSMLGGSGEKVFQQDHQTGLEYSRNVQKIIAELVKNLESSHKTLTDEEVRTIGKKMADFERLERELFETAWNIQKYSQLLKVVEVEARPELVSYKHIEKFVEKYNHLLSRYERNGNSFNTLISLLQDCCEGGEGDGCKTL